MGQEIPRKEIAIFGATSHIAKGLIYNFSMAGGYKLFLFARSLNRVQEFLNGIQREKDVYIKRFEEYNNANYDVIINCVGIGEPAKLKNNVSSIFRLTEMFDNLVLDYLEKHPEALYINFSSGAAYGTDFNTPVDTTTCSKWNINTITEADYYGIAKFNSEAKHRSLKNLNIVDLRIFGYFSRFINLESKYFLTEIISCIKEGKEFITDSNNIVRDYIHPKDLHSLIEKCIKKYKINDVFDAYSLKPVKKFDILDYFKNKYGLNYVVKTNAKVVALTGSKDNYYSNNRKAQYIGYKPKFTSMDCITQETKKIIM